MGGGLSHGHPMKILIAGGRQHRDAGVIDRSHRPLYDKAILACLDSDTKTVEPWFSYTSPDAPPSAGHRFGAPSISSDTVIACTEREVLHIGADQKMISRWSHPAMSDLHHAAIFDGTLHAVSTGADGVLVQGDQTATFLSIDKGTHLPQQDLRDTHIRSKYHPNYIWQWRGRRFVTLGRTGQVTSLDGLCTPIDIAQVVIHDGLVTSEGVWLTSVDGQLLLLDPQAGRVVHQLALADAGSQEPLGWCRGLAIAGDIAWVGFTRIRTTTLRRSLAWVRGRLRHKPIATRRPTRILGIALATGKTIAEIPLDSVEIDVLMGLVVWPDP